MLSHCRKECSGLVVLLKAEPFPAGLVETVKKVRGFQPSDNWLNAGPTSTLDFAFLFADESRWNAKVRKRLTMHFLGRYDQICFKLYAAVDDGDWKTSERSWGFETERERTVWSGRMEHYAWRVRGYRQSVKELLRYLGHDEVAEKL